MDMAEKKYQADVNFITLYAENDEEQQEELIVREIKDGANAIILAPVREDLAVMKLDEISPGCPVIFLGPTAINSSVACSISVDRYEMGRTIGEKIAESEDPAVPVCLFSEGMSYTGNLDAYDGIRSALDPVGFTVRLIEKKSEDTYRRPSRKRYIRRAVILWRSAWMLVLYLSLRISWRAAVCTGSM